jgi:hypothetical protein
MQYESRTAYHPAEGVGENLAFTGTSAQSAALRGGIYLLSPTQTCYIRLGSNPTAAVASGSVRVPQNAQFYVVVKNGEKIAAIQEATGGTLNISLMQ